MDRQVDVCVIGAGPAGLAAACAARSCGLDVAVVDEQAAPGGQLLRNIESPLAQSLARSKTEIRERHEGLQLVQAFRDSGADYYPHSTVWGLEPRKVQCTIKGQSQSIRASNIIVACGAMERPVPFPGWTLPGVMGAGGADILLRSGGTPAPDGAPVVMAGNGPLLLLLAGHLLEAGVNIVAWLDTGDWKRRMQSGAFLPAGVLDAPYLRKGLAMAWRAVKGKIPFIPMVSDIRALGSERLEELSFTTRGQQRVIKAAALLRHEGIIPRTHMLRSLHAAHAWDKVQRYWYPVVNAWGATSIDGVYMAGDGAYVHGGDASQLKGTLAGIDAARRLGVIDAAEAKFRGAKTLRSLRSLRVARSFLRYVFAPQPHIFDLPDDTLVCRCECVTAGDIRAAVAQGYTEVNEVKRFTRCGMGQCQGRMCGTALAEVVASAQGKQPQDVGSLNIRQPLRPVSLEEYCNLSADKT